MESSVGNDQLREARRASCRVGPGGHAVLPADPLHAVLMHQVLVDGDAILALCQWLALSAMAPDRQATQKAESSTKASVAGNRTRVSRVRAVCPNRLDYDGT